MNRFILACSIVAVLVTVDGGRAPAQSVGPVLNHCSFQWSEPLVPANNLAGFNIYVGSTSGGPYVKVGSVASTNTGGGTSYVANANFCGSLPDGQKFAVVKAFNTAGTESVASNESPFALDVTVPPAANNFSAF